MGGTPTEKKQKSSSQTPSITVNEGKNNQQKTPEEFMNQALDEALKEVKVNKPSSVDSILDDKEIMQEIGAIFERGNDKLMESLEEMRREQVRLCALACLLAYLLSGETESRYITHSHMPNFFVQQQELAKASAAKNAQSAKDSMGQEAVRLSQAEASMGAMLKRVNQETAVVEKAVQDLEAAQKQLDNGVISKLRNGGIPKQAALAGFLLFSVRSLIDTIAALNDETLATAALLQGAIAIVCAAIFFLL
jgi:hypothetical protein